MPGRGNERPRLGRASSVDVMRGRMDETPIGVDVMLLDPTTRRPLLVRMVDPATLKANPDHPRDRIGAHDERYRAGRDEMRSHGLRAPLVALEDGFLVDGHRRLATAIELGIERVPVCFVNAAQVRAIVRTYSPEDRVRVLRLRHIQAVLARVR